MSWLFYYLLLFLFFLIQSAWKNGPWFQVTPDLLLCFVVILSLFGKPRKIFFLVIPAAILRAGFSLESTAFIFAFFALVAFLLQEGRRFVFPEKIRVQMVLAFFVAFVFFTMIEVVSGTPQWHWQEALWTSLFTAFFGPLLFLIIRAIPFFQPLLERK